MNKQNIVLNSHTIRCLKIYINYNYIYIFNILFYYILNFNNKIRLK